MNRHGNTDTEHPGGSDPLGLRDLPLLTPDGDCWAEVRAQLETDRAATRRSATGRWLALAACLVIVAGLVTWNVNDTAPQPAQPRVAMEPTPSEEQNAVAEPAGVEDLIAMSQVLEQRLRILRDNTASMPAESAAYVAELEDLVARVDSQIGYQPESMDLWGQRVNLLLDLEYLFQHQFEREYGRMASL